MISLCFSSVSRRCDWPQCNSKTLHNESAGRTTLVVENAWPQPGKFTVRIIATDHMGGTSVHDAFFLVYKTGDTNKSAPCCRYNAQVNMANAATNPSGTLHRNQWTGKVDVGSLYKESLYDFGIMSDPWPKDRLKPLTCKALHHGGRNTDISWGAGGGIAKMVGTSTRYILMPCTGAPEIPPALEYFECISAAC